MVNYSITLLTFILAGADLLTTATPIGLQSLYGRELSLLNVKKANYRETITADIDNIVSGENHLTTFYLQVQDGVISKGFAATQTLTKPIETRLSITSNLADKYKKHETSNPINSAIETGLTAISKTDSTFSSSKTKGLVNLDLETIGSKSKSSSIYTYSSVDKTVKIMATSNHAYPEKYTTNNIGSTLSSHSFETIMPTFVLEYLEVEEEDNFDVAWNSKMYSYSEYSYYPKNDNEGTSDDIDSTIDSLSTSSIDKPLTSKSTTAPEQPKKLLNLRRFNPEEYAETTSTTVVSSFSTLVIKRLTETESMATKVNPYGPFYPAVTTTTAIDDGTSKSSDISYTYKPTSFSTLNLYGYAYDNGIKTLATTRSSISKSKEETSVQIPTQLKLRPLYN